MDDTRSKPTFFERLISRLAGEPDSAEDVLSLLRQAHEQEVFDADTLLRLEKVLDFADLEVRDAMITRSHMNVLKENDSIERITAYVIETAHSRFPVIGEDKDEVLGILHAKDLLKYMFNPEQFNLKSILRPAVFVPEGKSLNALLKEFREKKAAIAELKGEITNIQESIFNSKVINHSSWREFNEIKFRLIDPARDITYNTRENEIARVITVAKIETEEGDIDYVIKKNNNVKKA